MDIALLIIAFLVGLIIGLPLGHSLLKSELLKDGYLILADLNKPAGDGRYNVVKVDDLK